ncbi:alpha/beta hydrolase [Hymenobacter terricola]|uniref:alpha/beta hydrolase n=1 Tax=Hymenobacter terricola TaxID=2819236 RepID=UPI001B3074BC|nr:alpha/beta hydrolase [Hymenobacter terricola]
MSNTATYQSSQTTPVALDSALSREVKTFLAALNGAGGPPLETLSPQEARLGLVGAQASVKVDLSGIEVSEKTIRSEGLPVPLHIVRPTGTADTVLPVFIFIHGGGWVLGDFPTHQRLVRDLVVESGYAAVFVDYTPSPEAQYPQAIHEIYAATKWVAEHGAEINVDGHNLAVVGNSVGGNMTAVTTLMAKEKGGPHIKLQIMMWPLVDSNFETESYQKFGQDRFLTTSLMKWMYDHYTTDPAERAQVYASPLHATKEQLQGLPPALIQIGEADILRDAAEAYGRQLDEAGVPVTTVRYNGMIHDFGLLNGLATLPQVRSLVVQAGAELKKHLGS